MSNEKRKIPVEDVMQRNLVQIKGVKPVTECAKLMVKNKVGSVIVDNDKIVTKGDLVTRVLAQGFDPGLVTTGEIASSPLITCSPDLAVEDAMLLLSKHMKKRLVVTNGSEILGILTATDILRATPGLITIRDEYFKIRGDPIEINEEEEDMDDFDELEGYCDNCNNWDSSLISLGGFHLCPHCVEERKEESESNDGDEDFFYL